MKMETKVKVITLNCWGIIGLSKHRKERMNAIAHHLTTSDYDFVFLQEIWSLKDFNQIVRKVITVLPYSHYFHSGAIGSGVCLLSKSPFTEVSMQPYSLNGYAHKIFHGDYYGGKVIGFCQTFYKGLNINLYVTHLHAEYNRKHDQYLGHRIVQAFELSQFVRLTSETCDLSILGGDLNTEPHDATYELILHNTGLIDSYLDQPPLTTSGGVNPTSGTCGHPSNPYTSNSELKEAPDGKRIDYILYKSNPGTSVQCSSCLTPLSRIPGHNGKIPYSDHEAVVAHLKIYKSIDARGSFKSIRARISALDESLEILLASLTALKADRLFYLLLSCFLICLLILTLPFHNQVALAVQALLIFLRVILSIALGFSLWMGGIVFRQERNAMVAVVKSMELLLHALRPKEEAEVFREENYGRGVTQEASL